MLYRHAFQYHTGTCTSKHWAERLELRDKLVADEKYVTVVFTSQSFYPYLVVTVVEVSDAELDVVFYDLGWGWIGESEEFLSFEEGVRTVRSDWATDCDERALAVHFFPDLANRSCRFAKMICSRNNPQRRIAI
jgi:hypothetical protein